jgi:hypothetical protein
MPSMNPHGRLLDWPRRRIDKERLYLSRPDALLGAQAFGNVTLTPTWFLIDGDGRIVQHRLGALNADRTRREIAAMLNP